MFTDEITPIDAADMSQPSPAPSLAPCRCALDQCLRNLKPHEYCRRNEGAPLGAL